MDFPLNVVFSLKQHLVTEKIYLHVICEKGYVIDLCPSTDLCINVFVNNLPTIIAPEAQIYLEQLFSYNLYPA